MHTTHLKIALVGPPGSGKTSVLEELKTMVNPRSDILVDFLPELATVFLYNLPEELKRADHVGLRQLRLFRIQVFLEEKVTAIRRAEGRRSLLVTDRGLADAAVYLPRKQLEFAFTKEECEKMYNNYDHVLLFEGSPQSRIDGILSSSSVRQEKNYGEISQLERKTQEVWGKYGDRLDIIPQQDTVNAKAQYVAEKINQRVGSDVFYIEQ